MQFNVLATPNRKEAKQFKIYLGNDTLFFFFTTKMIMSGYSILLLYWRDRWILLLSVGLFF